ncbi:MAG: M48 family peptidase [Acidobacteriia bacterium]|jgi:hypothetical protein|nr:M48 family peptidase [Terriglobia bacterium]
MKAATGSIPVPGGARLFLRMFTRLGCPGRPPAFRVEFYPYAGLTHTIRLREQVAQVRLSDLLRDAPLRVQEAAAALLLARLYRRQLPPALRQQYREFALAERTRRKLQRLRRARGRRPADNPRGRCYDLEQLFRQLNRRYFGGRLRPPRLGWSCRAWTRQLGVFDPALKQIVLNRRLDRPSVPRYAVEYVLFHEMLHVKHPARRSRCGLQTHSVHFRREEKQFAEWERAQRFFARWR